MKGVMGRKFEGSSGSLWRSGGEIDLGYLRVLAGKVVEIMIDGEIYVVLLKKEIQQNFDWKKVEGLRY